MQKLIYPPAENLLFKDYEQPRKRIQPRAKPKLNSRLNNSPPRNEKAAARKRMKAAKYIYSLPDPPIFRSTYRSDRKKAVNEDNLRKMLKQAEIIFLEELNLNAIL